MDDELGQWNSGEGEPSGMIARYIISDPIPDTLAQLHEVVEPNRNNIFSPILTELCESQADMWYTLQSKYGYNAVNSLAMVLAHTQNYPAALENFVATEAANPGTWESERITQLDLDEIDPLTAEIKIKKDRYVFTFGSNEEFDQYRALMDKASRIGDLEDPEVDYQEDTDLNLLIFAKFVDQIAAKTGTQVYVRAVARDDHEPRITIENISLLHGNLITKLTSGDKISAMSAFDSFLASMVTEAMQQREGLRRTVERLSDFEDANFIIKFSHHVFPFAQQLMQEFNIPVFSGTKHPSVLDSIRQEVIDVAEEALNPTIGLNSQLEDISQIIKANIPEERRMFLMIKLYLSSLMKSKYIKENYNVEEMRLSTEVLDKAYKRLNFVLKKCFGRDKFKEGSKETYSRSLDTKPPSNGIINAVVSNLGQDWWKLS